MSAQPYPAAIAHLAATALVGLAPVAVGACGDGGTIVSNATPEAQPSSVDDAATTACRFTLSKNELSARIPTVGAIEWSLNGEVPSSAKVVFNLRGAESSNVNRGGEAPVDLGKANYRTLLLGLKPSRDYSFHIEATRGSRTCVSERYDLPTTGSLPDAPTIDVQVVQRSKREPGFIVTSSGTSLPASAFIIDGDGDVVWYVDAPQNPTRALMDDAGENMWMLALNLVNQGGEMRYVSMDGERAQYDVPGLERAHHDFTMMPGGKVAALAWSGPGIDPESELVIRSPDGTLTTAFTIGSNLYASETYHANAVHYVPFDGGFTIADRNPGVFVKVSATGVPEWQLGGQCGDAPAGSNCAAQEWQINHGHQLFEDGTFVMFNNRSTDLAHVIEYNLHSDESSFSPVIVSEYTGAASSSNLGDVQRLPGGNTLVTYSAEGKIVELDPSWNTVQSFLVRVGYSSWRPTLYGPPSRW